MATSLWNLLSDYKVVIPILQRDYAQGRETGKVPAIRERFLEALSSAIKSGADPLELDFVYGYINEHPISSGKIIKTFVPLDGQQRLTTLFLLHWFIAAKENHLDEAEALLSNFTYETRHSSRVFCEELIKFKFKPNDLNSPIGDTIIDQPWFFTAWKNDPTVSSMLIVLNAIQVKFRNTSDVWPLLISNPTRIGFHLLPMEKLGLPDDLYIKMNSRGKELTEFEYFKSRFSEILNPVQAEIFNNKIDQAWSDMFWDLYKGEENIDVSKLVDSAFLRFFRFISDILSWKYDIRISDQADVFYKYIPVYRGRAENVSFLFSCLDVFHKMYSENNGFFDSLFYIDEKDFKAGKTRIFFQNASIDLFKKCADNYPNNFSYGEQLILHACILHLFHNTSEFGHRIRKLRNLISNSEDAVRKENMRSLLNTVSEIILNDEIPVDSMFNKLQTNEEINKQEFIKQYSGLKEAIYKLEDHHLLQGCIAIFKLEDDLKKYAPVFHKIFTNNCDYETINRALLTFGDYFQKYGKYDRLGNSTNSVWRELFTPSQRRVGFERTQEVLYNLLAYCIQNPQSVISKIVEDFLDGFVIQKDKPKAWNYYFIKYKEFRNNSDGYYYWPDRDKRYDCFMMRRSTRTGFYWSPFLYTLKANSSFQLQLEDYGHPLIINKGNTSIRVINANNGFILEAVNDESKKLIDAIRHEGYTNNDNILTISQNEDKVDTEDRIEKGLDLISKIKNLDK